MIDMAEVLQTFIAESQELLQQMEQALLDIEQNPDDPDTLNAIFRAAHTIKGSAGLFGFDLIVAFTHVAESVLDRVRSGELPIDGTLSALLLEAGDHLAGLIAQLDAGASLEALPVAIIDRGETLISRMGRYLEASPGEARGEPVASASAATEADMSRDGGHWHLSLRFGMDSLRNGMDPLAFFRYLNTFGRILHVEALTEQLPTAAEMDPESCYLGFELAFASDADRAAIEGAFEFVREDSLVQVLPPAAGPDALRAHLDALPEDAAEAGERLLRCASVSRAELDAVLAPVPAMAETAAEMTQATPSQQKAPVDGPAPAARVRGDNSLIRVDAGKLDQLINLIGELIIAGAGARMIAQSSGLSAMVEATEVLSRLVEEVRDSALTLRMVQIGGTFNRFQRVVRDVARELGKDITLQISGGDTELDKTVVEKIGDPLTHLVRNAMDHGIEPLEVRRAAGKPLQGRVSLNAYHEAGGIVIEVSDDGGGLDPQKILAKALQRGLVADGQALAEKDILNLIFEPGFSTAETVSNLSGRGVGMDVVKRNITALRGTVELDSSLGIGTCVRIRLPLTLAIIDGFRIGVGQASYVVPLDMVEECIELPAGHLDGQDYLDLRGDVLPFIRLRQLFDENSTPPRRENVVVVRYAGSRAGLVVDQLLGEFQTVIKPLSKVFDQVSGFSGFTILGSGAVALILDIPGLLGRVARAPLDLRQASPVATLT